MEDKRSDRAASLRRYGCVPIVFSGHDDALRERLLHFDAVVTSAIASTRQQYEAFAGSVRDVVSWRWRRTEGAYPRFSSERTIAEYVREIWAAQPWPVD